MMNFIIENWYIIIAVMACGYVCFLHIKKMLHKPTETEILNFKEWLLYAVTEAETALGSNTGQLKLHMVYDMAIGRFEWLSIVSFDVFKEWVDEALEEMRTMLTKNKSINDIVKGEKEVQ